MTAVLKWTVLGALFLIPFLPLYVADGMFFPFITSKGFAFRILVELAVLGWVLLALLDKRYRPRFSWVLGFYGLLVVWMAIADLFAVNPHKSFWSNYERMDGWVTMVHVFLLFAVTSSVLSVQKLWSKWWLAFLSGSALICAYGLLQILDVLPTHMGDRVDASFGNAAYLPAYLLFGIAISLWQGFERKGWLRYSLFLLSAVQVFILLFTATRGALLGLVGAVVFGAVLYAWQSKKGRVAALAVFLSVVLLAGGFFALKDSALVKNSPTLSRLSSVFSLSEELGVRFEIWNIGVQGFLAEPITGYGHEGFIYAFNTYYSPELYSQEQWFDRAHNVYLDWLIAGGAPALILFLALLGYASLALFRKEFTLRERIFILGAFCAYAIQGIVVFDNLFTYVPLAMLLAYIHERISKPIARLESAPEVSSTQAYAVGAVGVAVGLTAMWMINAPGISGSLSLIRSYMVSPALAVEEMKKAISSGSFATQEIREEMVKRSVALVQEPSIANEVKVAMSTLAISEMGKEVARVPGEARLRVQYAMSYRAVNDITSALREIDAALALSPHKQTLYIERGTALWQAERFEEARVEFYKAYELDKTFAGAAAHVAASEIVLGNKDVAQELLRAHYDATLTDAPPLLFTALTLVGDNDTIVSVLRERAE